MPKIPFNVYDFFAYLFSGGAVLAAADSVYGGQWLLAEEVRPAVWLLLLAGAYVLGHVLASFSSWLFEQTLVGRLLGRPSRVLMGAGPGRFWKAIFPLYTRPLPAATRERVRRQARARGLPDEVSGDELFHHVFGVATRDDKLRARLDEFRNLYGFARNMALALLAVAAIAAHGLATGRLPSYGWTAVAALAGLAMLYRYLKFFREYSRRLFVAYAELEVPAGGAGAGEGAE